MGQDGWNIIFYQKSILRLAGVKVPQKCVLNNWTFVWSEFLYRVTLATAQGLHYGCWCTSPQSRMRGTWWSCSSAPSGTSPPSSSPLRTRRRILAVMRGRGRGLWWNEAIRVLVAGLSKFARLARSVTRSKASISSSFVSSVPTKSAVNVSEVIRPFQKNTIYTSLTSLKLLHFYILYLYHIFYRYQHSHFC